jgi:hypothetical protein
MRLQVLKSTSGSRGIDLEASAAGRRYFITITPTAVLWHDSGFNVLADGLDNHSAAHTFRISVRRDGIAQVTRDGEPLGVRPAASGIDPLLRARGAYLQWGEGAGASEADARVEHVAYDLNGAFD